MALACIDIAYTPSPSFAHWPKVLFALVGRARMKFVACVSMKLNNEKLSGKNTKRLKMASPWLNTLSLHWKTPKVLMRITCIAAMDPSGASSRMAILRALSVIITGLLGNQDQRSSTGVREGRLCGCLRAGLRHCTVHLGGQYGARDHGGDGRRS